MRNWLFPLWVIVDVLILISSLALWISAPEYRTLNFSITGCGLGLGILLIVFSWREFSKIIKSPYFKRTVTESLNIFLVLCILGLINYLGYKNLKEVDLTIQKKNSLTSQTLKVMEMIKAPVKLNLFAKREEWHHILNVLKLYKAKNSQIEVNAIDTDARPDLVKKFGITANNTVVIEYKDKKVSFVVSDELSITNGLLKILRDEEIVVYMTVGHKELSCDENHEEGLSVICDRIRGQNYIIRKLDLTTSEVPRDARAVLVLGPALGFLDQEVQKLKTYLERGGNLVMALAPSFSGPLYANLSKLSEDYGLVLGQDIVIDNLSTVQGTEATIPIITQYDQTSIITQKFDQRTIFPMASSVRKSNNANSNVSLIALTSPFPGSWAETNLNAVIEGKAKFEEKEDLKGPVGLIGTSLKESKHGLQSHLVLIGSSSFLINSYQNQSGNSTLFLNTLSWLVEDEGIISFNRAGLDNFPVILSEQHMQMIFVISILLVPIIFFGAAIFIYRKRRLL